MKYIASNLMICFKGIFIHCLFALFLRWINFCDPHLSLYTEVVNIHPPCVQTKILINRGILKYWLFSLLLILLVLFRFVLAESVQLPDYNEFNRGINAGSEISLDHTFQGLPVDQLLQGIQSPIQTEWESHSTLTTGLFLLHSGEKQGQHRHIFFYLQSFGLSDKHSSVWVAIRYYDRHGVMIKEGGMLRFEALDQWREVSVPIEDDVPDAVYAEVWFVKFEDADQSGETVHPVNISAIRIQ